MERAKLWDFLADRYGFAPWEISRLHPDELERYLVGARERQQEQQRNATRETNVSQSQRQRERETLQKYA